MMFRRNNDGKPGAKALPATPRMAACLLLLAGLALSGCGRPKDSTPPPAAQPAAPAQSVSSLIDAGPTPPPAPVAAPAPEVPAAAANSGEAPTAPTAQSEQQIRETISAALQAYYLANVGSANKFQAPPTLDALVKGGQLRQIPSAPPGKKLVYHPDRWEVTIEDAK